MPAQLSRRTRLGTRERTQEEKEWFESQAVRITIETHQPLLSMRGHIHELRTVIRMGRTVAVNPGSEYGEGLLRGIIITLNGDEVESTQMTSG